jgi:hypothetical protein
MGRPKLWKDPSLGAMTLDQSTPKQAARFGRRHDAPAVPIAKSRACIDCGENIVYFSCNPPKRCAPCAHRRVLQSARDSMRRKRERDKLGGGS